MKRNLGKIYGLTKYFAYFMDMSKFRSFSRTVHKFVDGWQPGFRFS